MTPSEMTNVQIIRELRKASGLPKPILVDRGFLLEVADRLEALDERVAIMTEMEDDGK